jgi:sec-independent protein translocase protein TatA
MLGNLNGWHFLILLVVILLVFGANKLPGLAKSLAESLKIFRNEMKPKDDDTSDKPAK